MKDGLVEEFYEGGKLMARGHYKNGKKEGLHESFEKNGTLSYRCYFKKGKKEGPS